MGDLRATAGGGRPAGLSMALAAVGAAPGCTDTRTVVVAAAAAAGTGKHPWSGQWGHSQTLRAALPTLAGASAGRTPATPATPGCPVSAQHSISRR